MKKLLILLFNIFPCLAFSYDCDEFEYFLDNYKKLDSKEIYSEVSKLNMTPSDHSGECSKVEYRLYLAHGAIAGSMVATIEQDFVSNSKILVDFVQLHQGEGWFELVTVLRSYINNRKLEKAVVILNLISKSRSPSLMFNRIFNSHGEFGAISIQEPCVAIREIESFPISSKETIYFLAEIRGNFECLESSSKRKLNWEVSNGVYLGFFLKSQLTTTDRMKICGYLDCMLFHPQFPDLLHGVRVPLDSNTFFRITGFQPKNRPSLINYLLDNGFEEVDISEKDCSQMNIVEYEGVFSELVSLAPEVLNLQNGEYGEIFEPDAEVAIIQSVTKCDGFASFTRTIEL